MAYTPTNWQTGDTITAEKLNKLEGGVENSIQFPEDAFIVNVTYDYDKDDYVVDKTWDEIVNGGEETSVIFVTSDYFGVREFYEVYNSDTQETTYQASDIEILDDKNQIQYTNCIISRSSDGQSAVFTDSTRTTEIASLLASYPLNRTEGDIFTLKMVCGSHGAVTFEWVKDT